MSPLIQGLHYLIPGLDAPDQSAGLQYSPTGGVDWVLDDAAVRQALLLLILTTPGERVMRPTYGCHLRRLLFAPNDDTTAGLAIHYVRAAIERWEPRIDILDLDATRDPDEPTTLLIVLKYRVRATQHADAVTIAYPLDAAAVAV
jgi:uncharacterized protein